jgi:hypothetical protein
LNVFDCAVAVCSAIGDEEEEEEKEEGDNECVKLLATVFTGFDIGDIDVVDDVVLKGNVINE